LKKRRRVSRDLPPLSHRGSENDPHKGDVMVIFVSVKLKKLFKKERNYPSRDPKIVRVVMIMKYGGMVMFKRFLMVIKH